MASFRGNTHGFEVAAMDVKVKSTVIYNGGVAIATNSGAKNVLFQYATIGYQTHATSVRTLG